MLSGVILGSSGTCPTKERNCSSVYLNLGKQSALLDCGEGTQRQLLEFNLSLMVDWVFISHFHLDHYIGILGLLGTMNLLDRTTPLDIYSPDSAKLSTLINLTLKNLKFGVNLLNIMEDVQYLRADCKLLFLKTDHLIKSYAILVKSLKNVKYRKELGLLPPDQLKNLVAGNFELLPFDPEHYIESKKSFYEVLYTGDTRVIPDLFTQINDGLIIHECSFFRSEETNIASSKYHTHINDFKKINLVNNHLLLTHLPTKDCWKHMVTQINRVNPKIKLAKDGLSFTLLRGDLKWLSTS